MDYNQTIEFLFNQLADFSRQGASGYKPGLERVERLAEAFGNPHRRLKTIHVAGTNGKGSTCHTLASILQKAGYTTGLFTSPHLLDFRERIRVNGRMIPRERVVDFTERYLRMDFGQLNPSFFELTTVMALEYFADCGVDYAIIEVGLGGRLDSTNIISPLLSVITNISLDHTDLLGDTPAKIAAEKAGIIKPDTPVVIGETTPETRDVFLTKARQENAPIFFAQEPSPILETTKAGNFLRYQTAAHGLIYGQLSGDCQPLNAATVLTAVDRLRELGLKISDKNIRQGFAAVEEMTGLKGRWTQLSESPRVIYDTAHNPGGWQYIVSQLRETPGRKHLVIGFVGDKDVDEILRLASSIPDAEYYLCQPSSHRALPVAELRGKAERTGLKHISAFPTVAEAYENALARAGEGDTVFVGGSNYVVADMLESIG